MPGAGAPAMPAGPPPVVNMPMDGFTPEQAKSVQDWVHGQIETQLETRFNFTGHAFQFVERMNKNMGSVEATVNREGARIDEQVERFNALRVELEGAFCRLEPEAA